MQNPHGNPKSFLVRSKSAMTPDFYLLVDRPIEQIVTDIFLSTISYLMFAYRCLTKYSNVVDFLRVGNLRTP